MLEFSISDGENFEFPPKLFGGKIEILSSSESLGVLRHIIGRKNSSERWDREVWEFAGFENQVREDFLGTEENILFCEIIHLCIAVGLRFVSDINAFNHFGG